VPTELTAGRLALEDAVPPAARGHLGELNKKGLEKVFAALAELGPDEYRQAAKRLMDLAARSTTASGGYSFGPEHMRAGPELQKIRDAYRQKVRAVLSDPSLSPKDRNDRLVQAALEHAGPLEQTGYKEALAAKNPLALQVHSGAKGKQENLRSLLAGDPLYTDQEFQPIPYPVLHSFAEGVRPHEYFAGTFGARQGLVLLKLGTAAAGYSSKRLLHAAHRLVVTGDDGPEPYDHKNPRGLPARALDPDNEGALLAHPAAGYPRDTVLTPEIMQELHRKGAENILVRSPLVGGPGDGGVYGKDVGVREKGVIAPRGDYVGIAASQALCLAAGTLVRMADRTVKAIEDVAVGDTVVGCALDGTQTPARVLGVSANGPRRCARYTFRRGPAGTGVLELTATGDHKILVEFMAGSPEVVPLDAIPPGTVSASALVPICGSFLRAGLVGREYVGEVETYDIHIDHPDHLFFLANGLVVSNSEPITQTVISCLAEGTPVRMADGSEKPIERVAVGDRVLGADLCGNTFPVTVTGAFDNGVQACGVSKFGGDEDGYTVLVSTDRHKLLALRVDVDGWDAPRKATVAECVLGGVVGAVTGPRPEDIRILRAWEAVGPRRTYDIEVDHPDHLFVLANGLIVSNSKHSGGVAGQTKGQQGFPVLDRLISIPETFPGGATHAQLDGHVGSVVDAPQGGRYVHVNGERHYVRPDLELKVKPGDEVEAGDVLTDGIPNPAEFVKHKGIGEGARRFLETFTEAAQGAGFRPHRRNLELVTRGLINHVRLDQPTDRYSAGEILPYAAVEADYRPRDGHQTLEPKAAVGQYLERPVLHYSVGTRVTPSVVRQLGAYGVEQVAAHPEPPPFSPVMVRSHETSNVDQDWLTRGLGIGVEKTLLRGVHRGDYADLGGTSYVPALAEGVGFGQPGKKTTGYDPGILTPRAPKPPPAPRAQ
jgi:hypothetical protein